MYISINYNSLRLKFEISEVYFKLNQIYVVLLKESLSQAFNEIFWISGLITKDNRTR